MRLLYGVGGLMIRGARCQANWSCCKRGAFYFSGSKFLPLFSHVMRTLRTSTVVLLTAALLAAVVEVCSVCHFCGLGCCTSQLLIIFGPSVFSSSSLRMCSFSCFPSCVMPWGRRKRRCCFPLFIVVDLPLCLLYHVFSLSSACTLTMHGHYCCCIAAVLKVCGYGKGNKPCVTTRTQLIAGTGNTKKSIKSWP